ncbi:uncharacterized protein LOC127860942 isoform X2 [Dreissena polymorpha]|uniref:uncharacterized protein LOC127860942 isoform X2 n=1 Tax=Dreissena polymorpha TaxID=45954 RepID=UPI002264D88A|nr:uncharacterized protein LOC127860942 isoform X2 [Dreissena polymorpha]
MCMKMDNIPATCILILMLIFLTECRYRISRDTCTWQEAIDRCKEFNGRLATADDFGPLRAWVKSQQTVAFPDENEEVWVGASLERAVWTWADDKHTEFSGSARFYARGGCHSQQSWSSGTPLDDVTPSTCLEHCGWDGSVGLKKDYCLCERDLDNISTTPDAICHIQCADDVTQMCGGYFGVSVYRPDNFSVTWANTQPAFGNDCAMLWKDKKESPPELTSANCDMQTRFLCSFSDDITCGSQSACIRSSSVQNTWNGAMSTCNVLRMRGGNVDDGIVRDLLTLAPGRYWIALRRENRWTWQEVTATSLPAHAFPVVAVSPVLSASGPISASIFLPDDAGTAPDADRKCAALKVLHGNIGLVNKKCSETKHYLCQYDYMTEESDVLPQTDMISVTELKSENISSTTSGSVSHGNDRKSIPSTEAPTIQTGVYIVLGFVAGMVCILVLGLMVYVIYRCSRPDPTKHKRLGDSRGTETPSVSYSLKDDVVHISPPASDVTYDTVYDNESPFRRNQRLIRMGSANSWRQTHVRGTAVRSDVSDSSSSDYTWRGVIGGKEEVVNTELRHVFPENSIAASCARAEHGPHTIEAQCDVHGDVDGDYDMTDPPGYVQHATVTLRGAGSVRPTEHDVRFLEIRTSRNSDNVENIYATIKKTFEKIQEDIAEQARREGRPLSENQTSLGPR